MKDKPMKKKTAKGDRKTGLCKKEAIPKGYKPRGKGQGQRPTE